MQLGDENIEKDNNEFSLEDDSAISWQDLLSEESDMSKIIEEPKETSVEDVDINSLADENPKEEAESSDKQDDMGDLDLDAYIQEHTESKEQPIEENNAETENESADTEPQMEPENVDVNVPYAGSDDALLVDDDKEVEVNNADLSGIVDDELLNLLDEGEQTQEDVQQQGDGGELVFDDITTPAEDPSAYFTQEEQNPDTSDVKEQEQNEDVDDNNVPNEKDNETEIEVQPPVNFSKGPSLIVIICLVVIVFVGIALGAYYLISSKTPNTSLDIEQNNVEQQENINNDNQASDEGGIQEGLKDKMASDTLEEIAKVKKNKQKEEDEKKLSESKVIFNVATSGRKNPFVPSSLYRDKGLFGLDSSLPYPPETIDDDAAKEARKLFDISVTGIMYGTSKPSAILKFDNKEYFVQVGDRIDTYTVHSITKDYVAIENQYNVWKAFVGETFEIDSSIPPSQQVKNRNGKRQYYSTDEMAAKK